MSSQPETKTEFHYLPCSIAHDGPAPVKSYFLVSQDPQRPGETLSAFRGRELKVRGGL